VDWSKRQTASTANLRQPVALGRLCSNDPVCAQHRPDNQAEDRLLSGAACHGCVLLAESSCERRNDFLDRALVCRPLMGQGRPSSMWTSSGSPLLADGVSAATLRLVASAVRTGQLAILVSPFELSRIILCPAVLATELQRLSSEWISAGHLPAMLDFAAELVETRLAGQSLAQLVWTGPESSLAQSRDTSVVVRELFTAAERSVVVSTFVIRHAERVFAALGARLDAMPTLTARIFVHIERRWTDTRLDAMIIAEYAQGLAAAWPGTRRPEVYYDPRGLSSDPALRPSWHAKCVVVDEQVALVTSANFTEWAHERNAEAGVLVRSPHFARQLTGQFTGLVGSRQLLRLPGF
jgi:hypothetical protein